MGLRTQKALVMLMASSKLEELAKILPGVIGASRPFHHNGCVPDA